jgi:hypothetical protein
MFVCYRAFHLTALRVTALRAGLRQSGMVIFFRDPALIPQRAVRAIGNVPGYYLSSRVAGLER